MKPSSKSKKEALPRKKPRQGAAPSPKPAAKPASGAPKR